MKYFQKFLLANFKIGNFYFWVFDFQKFFFLTSRIEWLDIKMGFEKLT